MVICILTPRFPFPENGGDVLRINNVNIENEIIKQKSVANIIKSIIEKKSKNYGSNNSLENYFINNKI